MPVVARILPEIFSDRGRGGQIFSSKLSNSRRNETIDLPCISVWGWTGLYYCKQINPFPVVKCLWKD